MPPPTNEERALRPVEIVVDGTHYVPSGSAQSQIGIGVTTHNRPDVVAHTLSEIKRLSPAGTRIVLVDDASSKPTPGADYRFEVNVGIARAKNKCLELLNSAGCEHIFLFDDDAYPAVEGWWEPYVNSPEPHLMWIFDKPDGVTKRQLEVLYEDDEHVAYHATRGAMLYVERRVLDVVGGMNPAFGTWGWEHQSWSDRIHSAGLTTWRYIDVKDSGDLIYSMDQHNEIKSTATDQARRFSEGPGLELRMESRHSSEYIEYRELRNVVMTTLLTSKNDPQRSGKMRADTSMLEALRKTLVKEDFVVLHTDMADNAVPKAEMVKVHQHINPYFERHLQAYRYLRDHSEIGYVWCVDGTDVQMLRAPWPEMKPGMLYLGSEPTTLRDEWIVANHPDSTLQKFFKENPNLQLLNAGLIGGEREVVMSLLQAITKFYFDDHIDWIYGWEHGRVGVGDMGALNYVARTHFSDRLEFGSHVNTVFKSEEKANKTAWWKHK